MGFFKALGLLVVIPIFGFLVSQWIIGDINSEINSAIGSEGQSYSVDDVCTPEVLAELPDLGPVCDEVIAIDLMQTASIYSAVAAVILLASFIVLALIAGTDRAKVARLFPPLVFTSLLVISVLVLIQGAILTYGAFVAESYAIERVHYILIGGIGIGALIGCYTLITAAFKFGSKQAHAVLGYKLDREKHKRIHAFVDSIAAKLGATPPGHIVVGLEPNFYVTSADVKLIGSDETLSGETLYLSLALARILTEDEVRAIVGHELGHFRGADTYYSSKFSPVYSSLSHALVAMQREETQEGNATDLAKLPAIAVLSYMMDVFHKNVSTISREREYEADRAATEVADPINLATSLLKIGLYGHAWNNLQHRVIDRLSNRKGTTNLSQLFAAIAKYDVNRESIPTVIQGICEQKMSHPTDSHPPTGKRIESLGLELSNIDQGLLLCPDTASISLIENAIEIEEELTTLQQKYYVAIGAVIIPDKVDGGFAASLLSAFAAHMILADGQIDPAEIDNAESIAGSMAEDFDNIDLREFCHYPESLPSVEDLLEASKDVADEGKQLILKFLQRISESDSDVSPAEIRLLNLVRDSYGLRVNGS